MFHPAAGATSKDALNVSTVYDSEQKGRGRGARGQVHG